MDKAIIRVFLVWTYSGLGDTLMWPHLDLASMWPCLGVAFCVGALLILQFS